MQRGRLVHYRMTGNVNKEMKCNVLGNIVQAKTRNRIRDETSGRILPANAVSSSASLTHVSWLRMLPWSN